MAVPPGPETRLSLEDSQSSLAAMETRSSPAPLGQAPTS